MKLVLTAPAKADLFSATEFYNDHEPELGARFLSAVDAKVEQILAFPESAQVAYRAVRQAKVRGFPYSIFYEIHEEFLLVVAVMHASRHPDAWKPLV